MDMMVLKDKIACVWVINFHFIASKIGSSDTKYQLHHEMVQYCIKYIDILFTCSSK